jgi:hypothetical protein
LCPVFTKETQAHNVPEWMGMEGGEKPSFYFLLVVTLDEAFLLVVN